MDKIYDHKLVEEAIYARWEEKGYFQPEVHSDGKPFTIILPPPNANAPLHFGHALMSIEDILIRYHRMKGEAALFLPGADHAGFETQYVFEKNLAKLGKSRFDYSREELYDMIWEHVQKSRSHMEGQLKKLGFSLDWSRKKFTLDPDVVSFVHQTFKKMYDHGLIYRDYRLVNFCTKDGTSFSDLEVVYEERRDPLYYIKYGPLVLATTRPETKFGDTGVAVNPKDKRYQEYVGKEIAIETVLGPATIKVVADESVDPQFGTGVVKVTPAHDFTDFETGKRHSLPLRQVIGENGRMNELAGEFAGLKVNQAREAVVKKMQEKGLIEKIDEEYVHRVALCYKCRTVLEPLPKEQWFVRVAPLVKEAIEAVREKKIAIHPHNFETLYFQWLENLHDWNISRQTVWGIRIPAWKNKTTGEWVVTDGEVPQGEVWEQDTDTFDTWFSSAQWPVVTLKTGKKGDFEKFYPTSVMETGYDILRAWVSRMVMMGLYLTDEVPFRDVVLHGIVNDPLGKKMSKSKGNVVDPLEVVEQYGADAVRFALVYGTPLGHDQSLSYPKLDAMRKFTNKLWNMARFLEMKRVGDRKSLMSLAELQKQTIHENDKQMVQKMVGIVEEVRNLLERFDFNHAAQRLYDFAWHEYADVYIEDVKNRMDENASAVADSLYVILLQLLHPFMPFVTEEIYQKIPGHTESIMISSWPVAGDAK